jgi:phosphatidylglycerol:prolipoprotein diacylglycerol transferase
MALALWMWRQIITHKDKIPRPHPIVAVIAVACGFGMAKLFHVLDSWDYYSQNLGEVFSRGGLSVFGGIIGATLFFWIYSRAKRYPFWFIADLAAPGVILAQGIGRVGCTINGCCHGLEAPSWLPWTITYSPDYPPPSGYENLPGFLGKALYPTQPYEIIFAVALFGMLLKLRGRLKPDGSLFLLYLVAYSAWRLGIGFLRAGTPFVLGLQAAQVISIVIIAITIPALAIRMRRAKTEG